MTRAAFGRFAAWLLAGATVAGDDKTPAPPADPAAEQLKRLRTRFDEIEASYLRGQRADQSEEGFSKVYREYSRAKNEWQREALAALGTSGARPEAFEVIAAVLTRSSAHTDEMVELLRKHHSAHPEMGKLFHGLVQDRSGIGRAFVQEMAEKSPAAAVRGQAALELGWQAKWRITQDGVESFGFGTRLTEDERLRLQARAEKYLTMAAAYTDAPVVSGSGTVAAAARAELAGLKNLPNLRVGKVAPDIEGEAADGTKFKLTDSRGKVTVLVFWASWCGPCMKMVPHERKLVERMKGKPFALVGVNGDKDRSTALAAAKEHGMTWPSFWDAAERPDGPITPAWNVHAWPTIYVLDAKGVIRFVGHDDRKLDELVDELIGEAGKK